MAHIVCNSNEGIVILLPTAVNYSHSADYIFHFDPLRSVRIFRVSKIVRLDLLNNVLIIWPRLDMCL